MLPWIICVATAGLDLLARFGGGFDFARVMYIEAGLFPTTAFALAYLHWRQPCKPRAFRVTLTALIWLFALGSLRPLLWTLGAPLVAANVAGIVVAIGAVLVYAVLRFHQIQRLR
jgi:hypothetical protein